MNPIGALRSAPFGVYLSDCVAHRYNPLTGLKGMYCVKKALPAETLIACLPLFACISPSTVMSSKAGRELANKLPEEGYTAKAGIGNMHISRDSTLVAAFTAMSMNRGPLKDYLANIDIEGDKTALREELRRLGGHNLSSPSSSSPFSLPMVDVSSNRSVDAGDSFVQKYDAIQEASLEVLRAVYKDVTGVPWAQQQQEETAFVRSEATSAHAALPPPFTFEQLARAHALCESRVLAVPTDLDGQGVVERSSEDESEEDILGGPALIPWLDLINHSDEPSNVAAAVMRSDTGLLPPNLQQIAPLCIVVGTRRDIRVGEQLTYEYMEPIPNAKAVMGRAEYEQRLLLWATRFHFIPKHMQ